VFCADVQRGTFAPAAAPVQAPRWNLESLLPRGLYCTSRASRAATCVHAHVGSPWPADERVCLDMLCGIPFVFGVLLRAQLTPSSRCRRHCALEGCSEFRVQRSYSSLCSRGLLEGHSPTSRSACTIIAIRDKGYVERDVRRMHE